MYTRTPETFASILLGVLLASPSAYALQDSAPVQLTSHAEVEVIETDTGDKQHIRRVPAAEVLPGKDVIYTLTFENVGTEPGKDIVIQNPIPEHTVYKTDSASGQGHPYQLLG